MEVKVFKIIFRLDFPLAYRILDKLGEYLEVIKEKTEADPYKDGTGEINLLQHSLSFTSKIKNNIFSLNLNLKTFNSVVEFQDGINISEISKFPLFQFSDEIIEKLENDHNLKYDRIGIRSYIIMKNEEYTFSRLKDYIWNCNETFGVTIENDFEIKNDIGVIFESKSNNNENIRVCLGPYQKKEQGKYFSLENNIDEGLILDIDIWQSKCVIPKLKISTLINNHQKVYNNLIENIKKQLKGKL